MVEDNNNNRRAHKIKGGKITPFSGRRETLEKFLETIGLHFILNRVKNDKDKITFTLTYLEGGNADSWRAAFLKRSMTARGEPNFGKWIDFLKELQDSFKPYDKEGDALDEIIKIDKEPLLLKTMSQNLRFSSPTLESLKTPLLRSITSKSRFKSPSSKKSWIGIMCWRPYLNGTRRL